MEAAGTQFCYESKLETQRLIKKKQKERSSSLHESVLGHIRYKSNVFFLIQNPILGSGEMSQQLKVLVVHTERFLAPT